MTTLIGTTRFCSDRRSRKPAWLLGSRRLADSNRCFRRKAGKSQKPWKTGGFGRESAGLRVTGELGRRPQGDDARRGLRPHRQPPARCDDHPRRSGRSGRARRRCCSVTRLPGRDVRGRLGHPRPTRWDPRASSRCSIKSLISCSRSAGRPMTEPRDQAAADRRGERLADIWQKELAESKAARRRLNESLAKKAEEETEPSLMERTALAIERIAAALEAYPEPK